MQDGELQAPLPAQAVEAWAAACTRRTSAPTAVAVDEALGLMTGAPVRARRSSPAFPAAALDGIAVAAAQVAGAAPGSPIRLAPGQFETVDTGDPLPGGRDTVIQHERIEMQGHEAVVTAAPAHGRHVRGVGEDVAAGELLFGPGHRLGPADLALAAAAGHAELPVIAPPTIAILPTGDELRPAAAELRTGELADTNSIMLEAQAQVAGFRTARAPILPDDPRRLEAAVREAAASSDLVLVLAGTSAGRHDHAPEVLRACGRIVASGVALRPGRPAVLAVVDGTPVMGCPGYPVSAAVAFDELVLPLLDRLTGAEEEVRPAVAARLATAVGSRHGAHERLRVALGAVDGRLVAVPLRRGASVLSALSRADGLISVTPDREGLQSGTPVTVAGLGRRAPTRSDVLLAGSPERALELLVLACAARGMKVAHCEMTQEDALALLADDGCHAAWLDGPAPPGGAGSVTVPVAEREIGFAVPSGNPLGLESAADLHGAGIRTVGGPAAGDGVPEGATRARSDDAALAAVAGGYADCALVALPAARAAGLEPHAFGRAPVAIALRRDAARRDPAVSALLDALASAELAAALRAEGYEPAGEVRSVA